MPNGDFDKMFPPRWLPAASIILKEPFSEHNRMINSTMKMVRPVISEVYKQELLFLYTPEAKDICNTRNMAGILSLFSKSPE
jgi:long-chain acyl-CoA synthetase